MLQPTQGQTHENGVRCKFLTTSLLSTISKYPPSPSGPLPRLLYALSITPIKPLNPRTQQSTLKVLTSSMKSLTYLSGSSTNSGSKFDEESGNLYIVVLQEGAVVRSGVDIDCSPRITTLGKGTVVEVERVVDRGGVRRMKIRMEGMGEVNKIDRTVESGSKGRSESGVGWISERLRGGDCKKVVERMQRALGENIKITSVKPSLPNPPPTNPNASIQRPSFALWDVRPYNARSPPPSVPHTLHRHPLTLKPPCEIFPDSPGWECDHCAVAFRSTVPGFVCCSGGGGCNWVICFGCFRSDLRAMDVLEGRRRAEEVEREDVERRERERREGERVRRVREEGERREEMRREGERRREVVGDLADMGFMEDEAERMVGEAMRILEIDVIGGNRRRVVELAVGFLTNGEEAIGEAEREREEERHREDRRARAEDMERREREEAERNLDEGTTAEERFRERRGAGVDTLGTRRGRIEEEIMRRIREEGGQGMNGEDGAEVPLLSMDDIPDRGEGSETTGEDFEMAFNLTSESPFSRGLRSALGDPDPPPPVPIPFNPHTVVETDDIEVVAREIERIANEGLAHGLAEGFDAEAAAEAAAERAAAAFGGEDIPISETFFGPQGGGEGGREEYGDEEYLDPDEVTFDGLSLSDERFMDAATPARPSSAAHDSLAFGTISPEPTTSMPVTLRRTSPIRSPPPSFRVAEDASQMQEVDAELERELDMERSRQIIENTASDVAESLTMGIVNAATQGAVSGRSGEVDGEDMHGLETEEDVYVEEQGAFGVRVQPPPPPPATRRNLSRRGRSKIKMEAAKKEVALSNMVWMTAKQRERVAKRLFNLTQFSVEFCTYAMLTCGDDVKKAEDWLKERIGSDEFKKYVSVNSNIYTEAYNLLGFKRPATDDVESVKGEKDDFKEGGGVEDVENSTFMRVLREHFFPNPDDNKKDEGSGDGDVDEDGEGDKKKNKSIGCSAFGTYMSDFEELEKLPKVSEAVKKGDRIEVEGEAEPKIYHDAPSVMSPLEEKIIKSIEVEKKSAVHKSICVVLCSHCHYVEFPGCGVHKQLLSVMKKNKNGKCAKCPCSTDNNGPWNNGCRICKSPTDKLFWSISIREAQFLVRAFPAEKRRKDETVKVTVLSCPCCRVVGFAGIEGEEGMEPALAFKTDDEEFDLGGGWKLDESEIADKLQHIPGCPNSNFGTKPMEKIVANICFDEAKYLYRTIKNVETMASFVSRSGFLKQGMQIVVAEDEGDIDVKAKDLVIGTYDNSDEYRSDAEKENLVCVNVVDERSGLSVPKFVNPGRAKVVTHQCGFPLGLNIEENVDRLFSVASEELVARSVKIVRSLIMGILKQTEECRNAKEVLEFESYTEFLMLLKLISGDGPMAVKEVKGVLRRLCIAGM